MVDKKTGIEQVAATTQPQDAEGMGLAQAQKAIVTGGLYPRLKLKSGDRAWFYSLSSGWDKLFGGAAFHRYNNPEAKEFRSYACVASFSNEPCRYCEDGHRDLQRQFAFWAHVTTILHLGDNPDESEDSWEQVKWEGRVLFRETVNDNKVIQLSSGRGQALFNSVYNLVTERGNFQTAMYQLRRQGEGLDTTYEFKAVNDTPIPDNILAMAADLPPILDLFTGTAAGTPPPSGIDTSEFAELEASSVLDIPDASESFV